MKKKKSQKKPVVPEVLPKEEEHEEGTAPVEEIADLAADVEVLPVEVEPEEQPSDEGRSLPAARPKSEVTRYDSLTAYLREISRYPRLTREEEHDLAVRYQKDKSIEAAYQLVSSNLWLVVKLAREYERAARSVLDLIQEGNIGLMEAVKNFDPYRGVRFPSYAVWWIRAYVIRYVIANWRMVKIGTTQAQRKLFFRLQKEKDRLEREGLFPGPKLLADRLDVREKDIVEMEQRLQSSDLSVDAPLQADSDGDLHSILGAEAPSQEELLSRKEAQQQLSEHMNDFEATLNENEKAIFQERMLGEEKATLQELADKLGLSRERIRQIENKVAEKLKKYFKEHAESSIESFES